MSMFGKAAFDAAKYASFRPTYPPSLYSAVLTYHRQGVLSHLSQRNPGSVPDCILDVGTGTGAVVRELAPHFSRAVAIDTSEPMLSTARDLSSEVTTSSGKPIEFLQHSADFLDSIPGLSPDPTGYQGPGADKTEPHRPSLVTCAQCFHWLNSPAFEDSVARVIADGGTFATWSYKDPVIVSRPGPSSALRSWTYSNPRGMGSHWDQPGRSRLRELIMPQLGRDYWKYWRGSFDPDPGLPADGSRRKGKIEGDLLPQDPSEKLFTLRDTKARWLTLPQTWMQQKTTLGGLEAYLRTYSAFAKWKEVTPEASRQSRAEGNEEGDMVDWIMDDMAAAEPEWKSLDPEARAEVEVDLVWGSFVQLARKHIKMEV
ncbi:methyltransferase-like protein [Zalerion maritima]|uniref:Methyltransferase-like protein n=1 Tax=Zalerion maritima TaxID=339359 RepID=A0AAD5RVS2_9PEZI|nr:methyltransferase-like protein [Zalerion maritima]